MSGRLIAVLWIVPFVFLAWSSERGWAQGDAQESEQRRRLHSLGARDLEFAPRGIDPEIWKALVPSENPLTPARVALGERLYFERKLSRDGSVSCSTCHDVRKGFTDGRLVSEGIGAKLGRRNAPTTLNAALHRDQFWDGRAASLEEQAGMPILNPIEMGQPSRDAVVRTLAGDPDYVRLFKEAYGREPNYTDLERAIASFERTLIFLDSPFDDFLGGKTEALSPDAQEGWRLFNGKGRCVACHRLNASNPLGTDFIYHNIGVAARSRDFEALAHKASGELGSEGASKETLDKLALETDLSELGRFLVTRRRADIGAFKTQQLRNVGITAPYMHDGSLQTLWDVMDHYNKGGEANSYLDGGIEPLALSEKEIDQLVAFLFALTDHRFADLNEAARRKQEERAHMTRPLRDTDLSLKKVLPFEDRVLERKR
jgi:cytochrome c peroxidase